MKVSETNLYVKGLMVWLNLNDYEEFGMFQVWDPNDILF